MFILLSFLYLCVISAHAQSCPSTEVLNSDHALEESIAGVLGATVEINCNTDHVDRSSGSPTITTSCTTDGDGNAYWLDLPLCEGV